MEVSVAQKILVYPKQAQPYRQKFLKRVSVQEFKKIKDDQIEMEYKILNSSDFYNEQQTIYKKKTHKNRYIDILVYQHSRVKCSSSDSFYMNGSHMNSVVDGKQFAIFAQAPTPQGFNQFWEAIYQKNVKAIIMLCNFHDPKRGRQAQQYWPDQGSVMNVKHAGITVEISQQQKTSQQLTVTHFLLKGKQGQKKVKHIHWIGWSDLKKPLGQKSQQIFMGMVKQCLELISKNQLFLVHCSAGIGRTGTLGTVLDAIRCAEKFKELSIFQVVQNLRKNRMYCVQTFEQYRYVYQELKRYFSK